MRPLPTKVAALLPSRPGVAVAARETKRPVKTSSRLTKFLCSKCECRRICISQAIATSTRAPRGNGSRVYLIALFIRLDGEETEKRPLRRNEPAARRLICMPAPMNDRRNDPFLFFYALDRREEKDFKQNNRNHSVLTFSLIFFIFLIFFSYFYSPLRRVALLFRAFTSSKNFDDVIKTRPEAAVRVRSEFTEKKIYTKGIGSKQSSASKCDPIAREKVDVPEFFAIKNK